MHVKIFGHTPSFEATVIPFCTTIWREIQKKIEFLCKKKYPRIMDPHGEALSVYIEHSKKIDIWKEKSAHIIMPLPNETAA